MYMWEKISLGDAMGMLRATCHLQSLCNFQALGESSDKLGKDWKRTSDFSHFSDLHFGGSASAFFSTCGAVSAFFSTCEWRLVKR